MDPQSPDRDSVISKIYSLEYYLTEMRNCIGRLDSLREESDKGIIQVYKKIIHKAIACFRVHRYEIKEKKLMPLEDIEQFDYQYTELKEDYQSLFGKKEAERIARIEAKRSRRSA